MTDTRTITRVVLPGLVEPEGLLVERAAAPHPGAGEVVVAVEATGVSFAEQGMRRGRYPGQPAFPFVPGYDLVGRVVEVGADVGADLIGGRFAAATKTGGWATLAVVPAVDLVPVPDGVASDAAEAVVVNGLTAWQMLVRDARVRPGGTVVVHGASGGVGTVLVQLARARGLRVIGTASLRHHEALRALGVEPVDNRAADPYAAVRELAPDGVDAVFDHIGLASARRSFPLLRRGGALIAYGTATDRDTDRSVVRVFAGMLALVADGTIVPHIAARFPLEQAAEALTLAESRTIRGKVVLVP